MEVKRSRAYLFRTASGSNGKGDVVKLKFGIAFLLASSLLEATESRHKPLRLAAEILSYAIEDPKYADFVRTLEPAVDEYHFRELVVHGFSTDRWLTYSAFPKIQKRVDPESLHSYRAQLQRFKRRGLKVTLSAAGPLVPAGFFPAYPEAKRITSGLFSKFIEASAREVFEQIPEADCLEIYFWETPLLNDVDFFPGIYWAESQKESNLTADQYYGPADYLRDVLEAYARGTRSVGKEFMFLTFCHYPWQERLLIEALRNTDPDLPITLDHKVQPGDWSPYRLANNVMLTVTDRKAMLLFDGTGEYWGQSLVPYCYPEEIQQRLVHALRNNRSIEAVGMRMNWVSGHTLFGNFNEVNWYALSRLARDPATPIEDIWRGWAERRFGRQAAPKVISALERTREIGNLVYYIRGIWVHDHSAFSGLRYLESHFVHYARSSMEWNPHDFRTNALLTELLERPRERSVEWVIADRREALRLNQLSLEDVESVRQQLPESEYQKLVLQLTLQRRFIEASIPHIESFLRYRIQKQNPSADNLRRLEAALAELERQAVVIEKEYAEKVPILTAARLRAYVHELGAALQGLRPGPQPNNYPTQRVQPAP